jgi:hypothetical protein
VVRSSHSGMKGTAAVYLLFTRPSIRMPTRATANMHINNNNIHHNPPTSRTDDDVAVPLLLETNDSSPSLPQQRPQSYWCSHLPPGSTNLYACWTAATAICVWFLFVHAPPTLRHRYPIGGIPPLLWFHLIGAGGVYLGCVHNAICTPSIVGPVWHGTVGRIALILGIVGFCTGLILAARKIANDPVFAIGITIGGVAQMVCQYYGYVSIKRYQTLRDETERSSSQSAEMQTALEGHVANMISLFVQACGIPALIRLAEGFSIAGRHYVGVALPVLILASILLARCYVRLYFRKIRSNYDNSSAVAAVAGVDPTSAVGDYVDNDDDHDYGATTTRLI